ncbi:MAG: arginase family protein [Flavobacteriales bacterium]
MGNDHLTYIRQEEVKELLMHRKGEAKLGEFIQLPKEKELLENILDGSDAGYVIIGIPEDIGPRANLGKGGANEAWRTFLPKFLNVQSNKSLKGDDILLLGSINTEDLLSKADKLNNTKEEDIEQLRKLVAELDERVIEVIKSVVTAGKFPIVVGGGHNNCYPCIKGTALGLKQNNKIAAAKIACANLDPHADFRPMEGRHSGNGFSYAFNEGYLDRYHILGLHNNYNSEHTFTNLNEHPEKIQYNTFEQIFSGDKTFREYVSETLSPLKEIYTGIEVDLDSVMFMPV